MFKIGFIFLMFTLLPLIEISVIIKVGALLGWLPTLLCLLGTSMLGAVLLRLEGFETLRRIQERLAHGELPGQELIEGALVLVGGVLMLTPGFVTDAFGLICLLPFSRRLIANTLRITGALRGVQMMQRGGRAQHESNSQILYEDRKGHVIIEGEYEEKEDK
jgi:UPF0716 protein FxsA